MILKFLFIIPVIGIAALNSTTSEPEAKENSSDKLSQFRKLFSSSKVLKATNGKPIDAYLLPRTDAHQSEYLAPQDEHAGFLSGFTGSNAFVIVTQDKALLWTDGRYFTQAEQQLSSDWTLMKYGERLVPSSLQWLKKNLKPGAIVGFDPTLFSYERAKNLKESLKESDIEMVQIEGNLVNEIWTDRPKPTNKKLITLSMYQTGQSSEDKIKLMREKAKHHHCTASLYSALDEIMWLLNIRGWDIPYNPNAFSYLFITEEKVYFFVDENKIDEKVREHLKNVAILPYDSVTDFLRKCEEEHKNKKGFRVLLPQTTNFAIGSIFENNSVLVDSPAEYAKAIKNPTELRSSRKVHRIDSGVLTEFYFWLYNETRYNVFHTELELQKEIDRRRYEWGAIMESFDTISSGGDHTALVHYSPLHGEGNRTVGENMAFMLDTGGHYYKMGLGTTDVTRTVWIGEPCSAPKSFIRHNTLVLKGHVNLALTVFPENSGLTGGNLDVLARQALWANGLRFSHATGHEFGHMLNVHEGPAVMSLRSRVPLEAGMFMTIEPGYYLPGKWGIRIESDYEIVHKKVPSNATNFLGFEPLTLVPIDLDIVDFDLLNKREKAWLHDYNNRILETVGSDLTKRNVEEKASWLRKNIEKWNKKLMA